MIVIPIATAGRAGSRTSVEARLRLAGAIDPVRAIDLEPQGSGEAVGLDEAIGLGRIVRMPNGRLFLNPAAVAAPGEGVGSALALLLLAAGSIAASVAALIAFAAR